MGVTEQLSGLDSLAHAGRRETHVLNDRVTAGLAQDYLRYRLGHRDRRRHDINAEG